MLEQLLKTDKKSYLMQNEDRIYATLLFIEMYKNKKPKNAKIVEECCNFIDKM